MERGSRQKMEGRTQGACVQRDEESLNGEGNTMYWGWCERQCPRELRSREETIHHVFWEGFFARKVWGQVRKFLTELGWGAEVSFEEVMYGLVEGGTREWEVQVVLMQMKVGLWEVRYLLVTKSLFLNERMSIARVLSDKGLYGTG